LTEKELQQKAQSIREKFGVYVIAEGFAITNSLETPYIIFMSPKESHSYVIKCFVFWRLETVKKRDCF